MIVTDISRRIAALLPEGLYPTELRREEWTNIQEIRLRTGHRPTILRGTGERSYGNRIVTGEDLQMLLQRVSDSSPYAVRSTLRQGFVTAGGGIRIGFCGEAVTEGGSIFSLHALSSASLRLPREVRGIAEPYISDFRSTLILSPPGGGKTTLLRDMVRMLSEAGRRVALLDERCEVAGCVDGAPSFDMGRRTDILSGGNKTEGTALLLRNMNPEILAMDEITTEEDCRACEAVFGCGAALLATAHAANLSDLQRRKVYEPLLSRGVFFRFLFIEPDSHRIREVRL